MKVLMGPVIIVMFHGAGRRNNSICKAINFALSVHEKIFMRKDTDMAQHLILGSF